MTRTTTRKPTRLSVFYSVGGVFVLLVSSLGLSLLAVSATEQQQQDTATATSTLSSTTASSATSLELAYGVVDWIEQLGGTFDHDHIEFRSSASAATSSSSSFSSSHSDGKGDTADTVPHTNNNLGVFATKDIEEGTIIMRIPRSAILTVGTFLMKLTILAFFLQFLDVLISLSSKVYDSLNNDRVHSSSI